MSSQAPVLRGGPAASSHWQRQENRFVLRGASHRLRLVRFRTGWLASIDTVAGPTLGCDHSPYLAISRALEPMGGGLTDAMSIVAELDLAPRAPISEHYAPTSGVPSQS
jgi:hypothetical protein